MRSPKGHPQQFAAIQEAQEVSEGPLRLMLTPPTAA